MLAGPVPARPARLVSACGEFDARPVPVAHAAWSRGARGGRNAAALLAALTLAGCSEGSLAPAPRPSVSFAAPAAAATKIAVSSGNSQVGAVSRALLSSFSAKVTDASGAAVSGVTVTFGVTGGGGALSRTTATTGTSGTASATLTLGPAAGANTVQASVSGLAAVTFTATGRVPARLVSTGGDTQIGPVSTALPTSFAAKAVDAAGLVVPGVPIQWVVTAGGGTLSRVSGTTGTSGTSTARLTLGASAGTNVAEARATGLAALAFAATGRRPKLLEPWTGNGQSGAVGSPLPSSLVLRVVDAAGLPVPGVGLVIRITNNQFGSALTRSSATTDANGRATFGWTLGYVAGLNEARVDLANAAAFPEVDFLALNAFGVHSWGRVAAGVSHTCGIAGDGSRVGIVYCWGWNLAGQVGDGTTTDRTRPVKVGGGATLLATRITAGTYHSCALGLDALGGNLWCWGANDAGQFGDGTTTNRFAPIVGGGGQNYTAVVAGGSHTCALVADGRAFCWGDNGSGQLGTGTTARQITPVPVAPTLRFTRLAAGVRHTCGITTAQDLYCWGSNAYGEVGVGSTAPTVLTPTIVRAGTLWGSVNAALYHTCASTSMAALYCWGRNDAGQLGVGVASQPATAPLRVGSVLSRAFDGGGRHTCAIDGGGLGSCWGANEGGQVGDGTTTNRFAPTSIGGPFSALVAGADHTCGQKGSPEAPNALQLHCWGRNANGQLGVGGTAGQTSAQRVLDP